MTRISYRPSELIALRGAKNSASFERSFVDSVVNAGKCPEILRVRHLVPRANGVSDHDTDQQRASAESDESIRQQFDGEQVEWKLQDRDVTDAEASVPKAPPADLRSQASAGFQQFYKAVVSPTHVRVTAGGRIVPNPRGTSPTGKVIKHKPSVDGANDPRSSNRNAAAGNITGQSPSHPMSALPSPVGFGPLPQVHGYMPFPMSPYGFPMPPMPPMPGLAMTPRSAPPNAENAQKSEGGKKSEGDKITPAVDDAASKPKAEMDPPPPRNVGLGGPGLGGPFPGPIPAPGPFLHPMPFPMPMMPSTQQGPQPMPTQPVPMSPMFGAMPFPGVPFPPMPMPMFPLGHPFPHIMAPHSIHGPASSIRMSEVTRRQIDHLRGQLKWVEGQLHLNKHQIDEKEMHRRVDEIRSQIRIFEKNLEAELANESSQGIKVDDKSEFAQARRIELSKEVVKQPSKEVVKYTSKGDSKAPSEDRSRVSYVSRESAETANSTVDEPMTEDERKLTWKKDRSRSKNWNMKQKARLSKASFDKESKNAYATPAPLAPKSHNVAPGPVKKPSVLPKTEALAPPPPLAPKTHNVVPDPVRKSSGLPKTAALAPPFQPRDTIGMGLNHQSSSDSFVKEKEDPASYLTHSAVGAQAGHDLQQKTLNAPSSFNNGLGQPYLEGRLPQEVDPRNARDSDYIYHRQLTEDEIRARHLYWGNAPRSIMRGLPKYDGKNFYPASPTKENKSIKPHPRAPDGNVCDYGLKRQAIPSVGSSTGDDTGVDTGVDTGIDPFAPTDLRALLEHQYEKSEKRQAQSDNVNGGLSSNKKGNVPARPATSLVSQEASDTDHTRDTGKSAQTPQRPTGLSDSESSQELLFAGRNNIQRSSGLLQNLGKKGSTNSANALPGAMSSTTAQGVLPHYSGSAAASLTPAIANASISGTSRTSPRKFHEKQQVEGTSGASLTERQGENKHPADRKIENKPTTDCKGRTRGSHRG